MNRSRGFFLFPLIVFYVILLPAQASIESKFISRVSQKRLQQAVRDLVSCGNRLGGTKSGDKAAKLVFDTFKRYEFKPEKIIDPEKLSYSHNSWQLQIEQPKRLRGLIQHEWLAGFSPSVRLETRLLSFVRTSDDIDEEKIDSGVVLLERPPAEKMYMKLADAGARCILAYEASNTTTYSNWAMISTMKESSKNPIPLFNISNIAGKRMLEELKKGTHIFIKYAAKTTIKPGNPKTVIATLKGESEDYYIVCAHGDSDSGGPGADDNASGVAGVMEIARILKILVRNKTLPLPRYSIRFIIWGSETFSSNSYVKLHSKKLEHIRGVINFDEIGIGKTRKCVYFEGNDVAQNHDLLKLYEKVGEDYVGKSGFWKEATTNPSEGGTDSYSFLSESLDRLDAPDVKIPSITIFTAAWNEPKSMRQTRGWISKAWKGHPDSVNIDYSPYYHSSLDIPLFTTDKQPSHMIWAVNAAGIGLIRLLWR